MLSFGLVALFAAGGCTGGGPSIIDQGLSVWDTFPFDGERFWVYNDNTGATRYDIEANIVGEPDVIRGTNVYAVEYITRCANDPNCIDGDTLYRIRWSSNVSDGAFIHGWDDGLTFVEFDPPLQVSNDTMRRNEAITTATAGASWTSTFLGVGDCPVTFDASWTDCPVFDITTDAPDGWPIAGRYWTLKGVNVVGFRYEGAEELWQLIDEGCEGDCDGAW